MHLYLCVQIYCITRYYQFSHLNNSATTFVHYQLKWSILNLKYLGKWKVRVAEKKSNLMDVWENDKIIII